MLFNASRLLLAATLISGPAAAQVCPIVSDVNLDGTAFSSEVNSALTDNLKPDSFVELGGKYFFRADSLVHGKELYFTDGTAAGTQLLKDINPGIAGGSIEHVQVVGSTLYFSANDGVHGAELWKSDGTTAGTTLVKDINPGPDASSITGLTALGSKAIFSADTPASGLEVWITDGTAAGTNMLADLYPGPESSAPFRFDLDPSGTKVFFVAADGVHGLELFSSDGTAAGTALLKDIYPGSQSSNPLGFFNWNGKTFFTANDGVSGFEFWSTDGTPAGTALVADIYPGMNGGIPNTYAMVEFAGKLYFPAWNPATSSSALYESDGTPGGTVPVAGLVGHPVYAPNLAGAGSDLFFSAHGTFFGNELWKLDAAGNASLVKELYPGSSSGVANDPSHRFYAVNGQLIFTGRDGITGFELWKSDGTTAGTTRIKDIAPGMTDSLPRAITPLGGSSFLFTAFAPDQGRELWISDSTEAGTGLLIDIDSGTVTSSSNPSALFSPDGQRLYFQASSTSTTRQLFEWDPSVGLTDLSGATPAEDFLFPGDFSNLWTGSQHKTLVRNEYGSSGRELWITDGTPAGTSQLKDIYLGPDSSNPKEFVNLDGKAIFSANSSGYGIELFITDGTTAGTKVVLDIHPGSFTSGLGEVLQFSSVPRNLTVYQGRVYFSAGDALHGHELWSTDGTPGGTWMVKDIRPGIGSSYPSDFTALNGLLYFITKTPGFGHELWVTDGTSTALAFKFIPGAALSTGSIGQLMRFKDSLLVTPFTPTFAPYLAISDGTLAGTIHLDDNTPGITLLGPEELLATGNLAFFSAETGSMGRELCVTDGTVAGTKMVMDIWPGSNGSDPKGFVAANGGAYFEANDGNVGSELWFTDGTAAGTHLVCDIRSGSESSAPADLTLASGSLFFSAMHASYGRELFRLPLAGAYVSDLGFGVSGSRLSATTPQLGQPMAIECDGIPSGSLSLLAMSVSVPTATSFLVAADHASWLDPASALLVNWFVGTSWSYNVALPSSPSLVGFQFNMQAYHLPSASFPAITSNGLSMVLGN